MPLLTASVVSREVNVTLKPGVTDQINCNMLNRSNIGGYKYHTPIPFLVMSALDPLIVLYNLKWAFLAGKLSTNFET